MANIVGIDLGTTYSAIAMITPDGKAEIIRDEDGNNLTPSLIMFEGKNTAIVGHEAKREAPACRSKGDGSIAERFKRHMGEPHPHTYDGDEYTPTDLSAMVLKRLKNFAEKQLGRIDHAVVTVPANFTNQARKDTLTAARAAGLNIEHIVNEPTAAALCYCFSENLQGTVAVYDLGGGTFDCSIVRIDGQNADVLCSQGNQKLGGVDFDQKLFELIKSKYAEKGGTPEDLKESDLIPDLEDRKKSLSKRSQLQFTVSPMGKTPVQIEISRREFEEAISIYITKAQMLVEDALSEAAVGPDEIDHVLLVGGSTRVPAVRASVQKIFNQEPKTLRNVDEVVALGAAYYAAMKADPAVLNAAQQSYLSSSSLQEVANHYFGTQIIEFDSDLNRYDEKVSVLINKNAPLPCEASQSYYTASDGQTSVRCIVSQSVAEETDPQWVAKIGEEELGPLPEGRPAGQEIQVTFRYDLNEVLSCTYKDVASGLSKTITFDLKGSEAEPAVNLDRFLVE